MVITHKVPQPDCDQRCIATISQSTEIVTAVDDSFQIQTRKRAISNLFSVLHRRAGRLVTDRQVRRRLHPLLIKFVCNVVMYFKNADMLEDFNLANIITALSLADHHRDALHGTVDFSTLIRRPNPAQPDADDYFVVGREGRINDPACPMRHLNAHPSEMSRMPREQLDVFLGFYYARQLNPYRSAPKIRVEDFADVVPREIRENSVLGEAFTDVCLSDGAWELYQRKVVA